MDNFLQMLRRIRSGLAGPSCISTKLWPHGLDGQEEKEWIVGGRQPEMLQMLPDSPPEITSAPNESFQCLDMS